MNELRSKSLLRCARLPHPLLSRRHPRRSDGASISGPSRRRESCLIQAPTSDSGDLAQRAQGRGCPPFLGSPVAPLGLTLLRGCSLDWRGVRAPSSVTEGRFPPIADVRRQSFRVPGPPFVNAQTDRSRRNVEVLHESQQLVEFDETEARSCACFRQPSRSNPTGKDDSRVAGDVRTVDLPSYHKDAHL